MVLSLSKKVCFEVKKADPEEGNNVKRKEGNRKVGAQKGEFCSERLFVMLEISYIKCVKFTVDVRVVPSGCITSSLV